MVELFSNLSEKKKENIKNAVELYFIAYHRQRILPVKLNELINKYDDIDEQEFCDFYITMKFLEEEV